MFKRSEVFSESFLPESLSGRSDQLETLQALLSPTIRGEPARPCWELGGSGVGKTTTARWMLHDLRSNYAIHWTHVECVGSTAWQLLGDICDDHPKIAQHPGMSSADMVRELRYNVDRPYVVILDEFDGLEDERLLIDLAQVEKLSLICIAHDEESAFSRVPDALPDLQKAQIIEFEPYCVDDLLDILDARVETGLEPGVVTDDQLHRIAEEAGGSARRAVQSLRSAVELGEQRNHDEVHEADVEDCFEHAMTRIREQLLDSLSRQHHILYRVIRDAGEQGILAPEMIDLYQERSSNPRTRQQVGNYRQKLERYDLIEAKGEGRWARYRVVDETLKAPLREKPV